MISSFWRYLGCWTPRSLSRFSQLPGYLLTRLRNFLFRLNNLISLWNIVNYLLKLALLLAFPLVGLLPDELVRIPVHLCLVKRLSAEIQVVEFSERQHFFHLPWFFHLSLDLAPRLFRHPRLTTSSLRVEFLYLELLFRLEVRVGQGLLLADLDFESWILPGARTGFPFNSYVFKSGTYRSKFFLIFVT